MQRAITLHLPDGTNTDWSRHPLADAIQTAAQRDGGRAVRRFFARQTRPAVDDAWIERGTRTIHLEAFDADKDYKNGTQWLADNRG